MTWGISRTAHLATIISPSGATAACMRMWIPSGIARSGGLHLIHNYDQCNKPHTFLDDLIPKTKDGLGNEQCKMFVDRGLLSNLAIQKFESEAN